MDIRGLTGQLSFCKMITYFFDTEDLEYNRINLKL